MAEEVSDENAAFTATLSATDPDSTVFTYTLTNDPTGGALPIPEIRRTRPALDRLIWMPRFVGDHGKLLRRLPAPPHHEAQCGEASAEQE